MKIILYTPTENRWKKSLDDRLRKEGHETEWITGVSSMISPDIFFSMWCDKTLIKMSDCGIPIYTYIRHYELYADYIPRVNWKNVKGIFFCAKHIQDIVNNLYGKHIKDIPQYLVPNWVDTDEFPFIRRERNDRIAMACYINRKKNLPLAIQILNHLPSTATIHHVGNVVENFTIYYINHLLKEMKMDKNFFFYRAIPPDRIPMFFNSCSYVLSTSIIEGCPMNILEGMACGLKPMVHNWIGAKDIFPEKWVYNDVEEARYVYDDHDWYPDEYRQFVIDHHNPKLMDKIIEVISK